MGEEEGTAKAQRQEGSPLVGTRIPLRSHRGGYILDFQNGFLTLVGKRKEPPKDLCRERKLEPSSEWRVVLGRPGDWAV